MVSVFAWAPGPMELVIVAFVVLLLFGNRLPTVMRNMGRGLIEFKKGMQGTDDEPRIEGDKRGESP